MIKIPSTLSDDEFIRRRIECVKSHTMVDLSMASNKKLEKLIDDKRFDEVFKFKRGDIIEVVKPIPINLDTYIKVGTLIPIFRRALRSRNECRYTFKLENERLTYWVPDDYFTFPIEIQEISTDEITNILEG